MQQHAYRGCTCQLAGIRARVYVCVRARVIGEREEQVREKERRGEQVRDKKEKGGVNRGRESEREKEGREGRRES